MSDEKPFDLYEEMDRIGTSEGGGGGGIVARCEVSVGYKAYVSGLPQGETFFAFQPGSEESKDQAKASADALATLHQAKQARYGVQIVVRRDGALSRGQPVTWSADARYFNVDYWTSASREVVVPSLKANGIVQLPWTGWARIGFKPDPYKQAMGEVGMTDADQQGNKRFPQVAYITEVFPDEATAKAQAVANPEGEPAAAPTWKPESEGWDAANLKDIGATLAEELKADKTLAQVATDYALTIGDALVALGEHRTMLPPIAVAKKYGVEVETVAAVRSKAGVIPF